MHIFSEADPDEDLKNVMFYIFLDLAKKMADSQGPDVESEKAHI